MNRALIVGAIAFALGYAAERLYVSVGPDIARYNRLREMSGQEPLFKEIVKVCAGFIGSSGPTGLIASTTSDVIRYAKMRGM